jgi:hypothetical protein
MTDVFTPKNAEKFFCEKCDFKCFKTSDWDRHILTRKHLNTDKILTNTDKITPKNAAAFICDCGRIYKHRQSLFNHKKKCHIFNKTQFILDVIKKDELVKEFLIEQNKQLSEQNKSLIEQNTKLFQIAQTNTTNTINNNYNSNNRFNINVFLNEQCKDALNINDFVNSLVLGVKDLEQTAKLGYVEGISKIFINGLNQLNIYKRPLHCNDTKREIFYIKDDDKWVKDTDNKDKITNAIKHIANKNIKQISNWQKENPKYMDPDSKQNDKYMKMLCEVMSGSTKEEQQRNYNKIIKNVSKEVTIKDIY